MEEARPMSASTTKALSLAIVAAAWAAISHLLKVNLQLWPVIVGLGCFVGAGGGVMGLQKSILGTISGVIWAALYVAVSGALGRQGVVAALVLGAGTYLAMGFHTFAMNGAIRVGIALAIGCVLGIAAERVADMLGKMRVVPAMSNR